VIENSSSRATAATRTRRSSSGPTGSQPICTRAAWDATPSAPSFPVTRWARTSWASTPTTDPSTSRRCWAPGARVAPFNVNYRYVKNELRYLLADSGATALLYHATFAPRVADVLPDLLRLRVLIQIADESGNDLVHGAVDYESIVASRTSGPPRVEPSPDDLYVLYTGGTTGMPKGVLWRQHDIFMTSFGGRSLYTGELANSYDEIANRCAEAPGTKLMILPPLIHGAAQWAGVANEATEVVVVRSVPVRHQRGGPLVDVVDDIPLAPNTV